MPLTFDSVINLCLTSGYSLSLFIGVPINAFIIYHLSSKDVKKSNYFRLLIFTCSLDIYQAVFGELDYWGEKIFDDFNKYRASIRLAYFINGEILYDSYSVQSFLSLIFVIHWKTVLRSRTETDRIMYMVAILYFTTVFMFDIVYQYAPDFTPLGSEEYKDLDDLLHRLLDFYEIAYLLLFSFISIFCIVSIRTVNTESYSPYTLKLYRRIALVHFIQCVLSMVEFAYQYIGSFIISEMRISDHYKSAILAQIDDTHYYIYLPRLGFEELAPDSMGANTFKIRKQHLNSDSIQGLSLHSHMNISCG